MVEFLKIVFLVICKFELVLVKFFVNEVVVLELLKLKEALLLKLVLLNEVFFVLILNELLLNWLLFEKFKLLLLNW